MTSSSTSSRTSLWPLAKPLFEPLSEDDDSDSSSSSLSSLPEAAANQSIICNVRFHGIESGPNGLSWKSTCRLSVSALLNRAQLLSCLRDTQLRLCALRWRMGGIGWRLRSGEGRSDRGSRWHFGRFRFRSRRRKQWLAWIFFLKKLKTLNLVKSFNKHRKTCFV